MRKKRAALTFIAGALRSVITLVIGFVATPYLLSWLGEERFGAFRTLSDWFGYFGLLEFGLYGGLLAVLMKSLGEGKADDQRGYLKAGVRAYAGVAALSLACGLLLLPLIGFLMPVQESMLRDLRWAALVLTAIQLLVVFQPFRAFFEAAQMGGFVNFALFVQSLLITGSALIFARMGYGIRGQAMAALIGAAASSTIFGIGIAARFRGFLNDVRGTAARQRHRVVLWRLQWPAFFLSLAGRIALFTDNIVISLVLGPAKVVPFFLTVRLTSFVEGQLQGVGNSTWAAMGDLYFRKEQEALRDRMLSLTRLICALAAAILIPVMLFNPSFMRMWVGADHYGGNALTAIATLNAFILPAFSLWGWLFSATGKNKELIPMMLAQALLNLIFSVVFTMNLNIIGPLLGTLTACLLVPFLWLPRLLKQSFGMNPAALYRAFLPGFVLTAACAGWVASTAGEMMPMPEGRNWTVLLLSMTGAVALSLAAAYGVLLGRKERAMFRQLAQSFIKKRTAG